MADCGCEGDMAEMMTKMMSGAEGTQMPTSEMMLEMMPRCLGMMMMTMPENKRINLVLKMIGAMIEQGKAGLSEEQQANLVAKAVEVVTD